MKAYLLTKYNLTGSVAHPHSYLMDTCVLPGGGGGGSSCRDLNLTFQIRTMTL